MEMFVNRQFAFDFTVFQASRGIVIAVNWPRAHILDQEAQYD